MNARISITGFGDYDPFSGAPLSARVPLTESQREIWLATQVQQTNLAYNEGTAVRYDGALDVAALQAALRALLRRHAILRATISPDGQWLCIQESLPLPFTSQECREGREAEDLRAAETAQMGMEFALEHGPLIRFHLVRVSPTHHELLIVAHHIVVDGWSHALLLTQLARLYDAQVSGQPAQLPPAPHYGDYVDAEQTFLASAEGQAHVAYWLAQLHDAPPSAQWPSDRQPAATRTHAAGRVDVMMDEMLVGQLRNLGARHGASLAATTLAGFAAYLHRVSGTADMIIGLAAAGQSFYGQQGLVGHCVNLLPLRLRPDPGAPFAQCLAATRAVVLDAHEHQGVTYGSLLPRLRLDRSDERPPLISIVFNIDVRDDPIAPSGLAVSYRTLVRTAENFELFVNLVDDGRTLLLECSYDADLFDAASVRRHIEGYQALLRHAVQTPQMPLADLELLCAQERVRILQQFQPAAAPRPQAGIHELIAAQAHRSPQAIAVECAGERWTYAQLLGRADAIAARLQQAGAGPGQFVGVCLTRTCQLPAALLAVLKCGAAYVPLDPDMPPARLAMMYADAGACVLLCERATAQRVPPDAAAPSPRLLLEGIVAAADAPVQVRVAPDSPAYVIYTSGSTGTPKGVVAHHGGLVNCLYGTREWIPVGTGDALLALATVAFDASVLEIFLPLLSGARLCLISREDAADGHRLAQAIAHHRITHLFTAPAAWRLLLSSGWSGSRTLTGISWAEALPSDLAAQLLPRIGQLWNLYGPTETTVWVTGCRIEAAQVIGIGRPIANVGCYILDEHDRPVPVGVPGQLHIGGAGVTLGYLRRPELTATSFIANPFAPGRLYRTGDLARWNVQGMIECLGRIDAQVKLRGFRIELGEVETHLNRHDSIAEAVCGIRERSPDDPRLIAWVRLREGATLDADALRVWLRAWLPGYMVPQHFVQLAQLPRLSSGKLDRRALPDPFAAAPVLRPRHEAPANAQERRLAALWSEELGLQDIGREDRFLDLGGHSLLAVRLAARLESQFGRKLPVRAVMMESLANLAVMLPENAAMAAVTATATTAAAGPAAAADGMHGGRTARPAERTGPGAAVGRGSTSAARPATIAPTVIALHPLMQQQQAFYFGPADRQLFGVLTRPLLQQTDCAVLVCHSWGVEYMRSYRGLHLFAARLASLGLPVLRFDYAGCGDSAGYSIDARVDEWIDNVVSAAAQLRQRAGVERLCVVGLRLGALIAARALERGLASAQLVLWDPPSSGRDWLHHLSRCSEHAHVAWNRQRSRALKLPPPPDDELLGLPMSTLFRNEAQELVIEALPDEVSTLGVYSADVAPLPGLDETVQLPVASHWTELSWMSTPWSPAAAINTVADHLREQLI